MAEEEINVIKTREGMFSTLTETGERVEIADIRADLPYTTDMFNYISELTTKSGGLKAVSVEHLKARYRDGLMVITTRGENGDREIVGTQTRLPLVNNVKSQKIFGDLINRNISHPIEGSLLFSPDFVIEETATALIFPDDRDRGYGAAMKRAMNARAAEVNKGKKTLTVGTTWKNSSIKANAKAGMVIGDPRELPLFTQMVWYMPYFDFDESGEYEVVKKYGNKDMYSVRNWDSKLPYEDDRKPIDGHAVLLVSDLDLARQVEAELQAMLEPFSRVQSIDDSFLTMVGRSLKDKAGETLKSWARTKSNLQNLGINERMIDMVLHLIGLIKKFNEQTEDQYGNPPSTNGNNLGKTG